MERSEPTFGPEWLRTAASVSGGGTSAHTSLPSSSHSDGPRLAYNLTTINSKSLTDISSSRSRTSFACSPRVSSNGSAKHAYSSFSRNHRDKDSERPKERLSFMDQWDRDSLDPLGNILVNREKDTLRRAPSVVSRKLVHMPRGIVTDSKNCVKSINNNGNRVVSGSGVNTGFKKAVFEKDFPSLGSEGRQEMPDISRICSPGLSSAVQSFPVGNLALIGGEGWTSALAEVPNIIGTSSLGSLSGIPTVAASIKSGAQGGMSCLNMAEALTQSPAQNHNDPQVSVKTQRLEKLAIKQSRQLIPVTPSTPKGLVLTSDKSKTRTTVRAGEMNVVAVKSVQHQPTSLHQSSQSLPDGLVKFDSSKISRGKLLVLKSARENGVSPAPKDGSLNNQLPTIPSVASAASVKMIDSHNDRKIASLNSSTGLLVERRPLSQNQSRTDFFNYLKKKTLPSVPSTSSPSEEKPATPINLVSGIAVNSSVVNGIERTMNNDCREVVSDVEVKDVHFDATVHPNEEEAAFLHSLGWEENSGEVEALTEDEINAFYQQCLKLKPSLKVCRGMQPKVAELQATRFGGTCSDLGASDTRFGI